MIKTIAVGIFKQHFRAARLFCSSKNPLQSQAKNSNPLNQERKVQEYDEFDDEEPKFERQNRNTPGWILYRIVFWGSTALLTYNLYLVQKNDSNVPVENIKGGVPGFIDAASHLYNFYKATTQYFTKPPLDKLLPDPVHPAIQPKTLVLNLTGTLVKTHYIFGKGLSVEKRPGLEQLLRRMIRQYEIVIFSDDDSMMIETLLPSLDPRHEFLQWYFGKECMVLSGKKYIKDIKYLNRDPRRVIVIDRSKDIVPKNKDNVIVLKDFDGDQNDRALYQLIGLLDGLAKEEVRDVRKTLKDMGDNPLEKYEKVAKENLQKLKSKKGSKLFGVLGNIKQGNKQSR